MANEIVDQEAHKQYLLGYRAGYAAGYQKAAGKLPPVVCEEEAVLDLPLAAMGLSGRAFNCLDRAGCATIRDAALLEAERLEDIRNLGKVTAGEIARKMQHFGIKNTAWDGFLL